jgi:ketosteroid isomerase-like protein
MKEWMLMPALVLTMARAGAQGRDAKQDERAILRAEAALCEAFESGDAAYLRDALDPRFTLVDSRGTVTNLEQNLQEVQAREPRYETFRNHGQSIRIYGDTAIITGVTSVKGTAGGEAFAADFRFTDTWLYRNGRWLLAASQASRLSAPSAD